MEKIKQHAKWVGMACLVLGIVQVVNMLTGYGLNQFGLIPRSVGNLSGILISPFLHASLWHFFANIVPLAIFKRMALFSRSLTNSGVINLNGILIEKLYFKDIMRTRVGIRRHNSFASILHSRQTT